MSNFNADTAKLVVRERERERERERDIENAGNRKIHQKAAGDWTQDPGRRTTSS